MLHYAPQHVPSSTLLILRRTSCITTASGIVTMTLILLLLIAVTKELSNTMFEPCLYYDARSEKHQIGWTVVKFCTNGKRDGQTDGRTEELLFLWMLRSDALAPRGRESCGWGLRV